MPRYVKRFGVDQIQEGEMESAFSSKQSYYSIVLQGVSQKTLHSWENQTLGTSYSETTNQLDLKLWQQGVLMRTPCCQSLRSNRLVVSEYEVPKVWFPKSVYFFVKHPVGENGKDLF